MDWMDRRCVSSFCWVVRLVLLRWGWICAVVDVVVDADVDVVVVAAVVMLVGVDEEEDWGA